MASACTNRLSALFTDLYELTMTQAYASECMEGQAVFELFFREMPTRRNYVVAAGLDDVLDFLEDFHFTEEDLAYLRRREEFSDEFVERLAAMRFTGDVFAMPEGTIAFPDEPLVQVVAPIIEAQLIETLVLNEVHFQTVVASKASRIVAAARGRTVVDFGSRRAHGGEAALKVARASYLAGAAGTSNVLAGRLYDVPIFGTMAHSYVQAHDDELQAFRAFTKRYPTTTLLVDTYETLAGVDNVIRLSREWGAEFRVGAVRLDSGDLAELSRRTRSKLDAAGLQDVGIFASSELDEDQIAGLVGAGCPIDGFGVGTRMAVSADAPHLDMAYKLVEYDGEPRVKLSSRKTTYPGRKQVFRVFEGGHMLRDVIAPHDAASEGTPLLEVVMREGRRTGPGRESLARTRERARQGVEALPDEIRALGAATSPYGVEIHPALIEELDALRDALER